jgi:hypothetical protein
MGMPDAETLEREYDEAVRNSSGNGSLVADGGVRKKVEVLPTLDARGKLYDVGHGKDDEETLPGNRKKKEKVCHRVPTEQLSSRLGLRVLSSSKLGIQRRATSCVTMQTTIRRH